MTGSLLGALTREPSPEQLEFDRDTGRHPILALPYRGVRLAVRLLGERRTFAVLADLARISHRLAYESAARLFGDDEFHAAALALDDATLSATIPAGSTVLDVGCGSGRWSRAAARYARHVVGVDHDPGRVQVARRRTSASNVEYRVADISDIADGELFDFAMLVHVIEHLDDPARFLRNIHEVARCLLIEVPDFHANPVNVARLAVGRPFSSDADHVREYSEKTLRDLLVATGWQVSWMRKHGGAILGLARGSEG